jgi:hypothetical protein
VLIALDREALEPTLPYMSAAAVMLVVTSYMARQQPLHKVTQGGLMRRFKHQMKMIRHQAKSENFNGMTNLRFPQKREEGIVVLRLVKHRGAAIATVNNMISVSALLASWNSRHVGLLTYAPWPFK